MGKRSSKKRTVYASLYRIPMEDKLKAHLIFIVGQNGKVEDYFPGPFTIGDYYGSRMKQKEAGIIVCSYIKETHPHMKVLPENVKLYSYKKANALLFQLQNK